VIGCGESLGDLRPGGAQPLAGVLALRTGQAADLAIGHAQRRLLADVRQPGLLQFGGRGGGREGVQRLRDQLADGRCVQRHGLSFQVRE
jgi:hypothetical protein